MLYISNAFPLGACSRANGVLTITATPLRSAGYVLAVLVGRYRGQHPVSVVGHADIARVMSYELGMDVPVRRKSIALNPGDVMLVAQYTGPRLAEGTRKLPADAQIAWWEIVIEAEE